MKVIEFFINVSRILQKQVKTIFMEISLLVIILSSFKVSLSPRFQRQSEERNAQIKWISLCVLHVEHNRLIQMMWLEGEESHITFTIWYLWITLIFEVKISINERRKYQFLIGGPLELKHCIIYLIHILFWSWSWFEARCTRHFLKHQTLKYLLHFTFYCIVWYPSPHNVCKT